MSQGRQLWEGLDDLGEEGWHAQIAGGQTLDEMADPSGNIWTSYTIFGGPPMTPDRIWLHFDPRFSPTTMEDELDDVLALLKSNIADVPIVFSLVLGMPDQSVCVGHGSTSTNTHETYTVRLADWIEDKQGESEDVVMADLHVDACSDFSDNLGHLDIGSGEQVAAANMLEEYEEIIDPPTTTTTTSPTTTTTAPTTTTTAPATTTTTGGGSDWTLGFDGDCVEIDGVPINEGTDAECLLLNARMVQAASDFKDELVNQIPNWNPGANTGAFAALVDDYETYGLNAVTVNFQGGLYDHAWGEDYLNSAWFPGGGMATDWQDRMTTVLDTLVENEMVPIVGLFYFRQDQKLNSEAALVNAVDNAITFLEPWKDQIIVEVINEASHRLVDQDILMPDRAKEVVAILQADGYYASFSLAPGGVPSVTDFGTSDVVLIHTNDRAPGGHLTQTVASRVALAQSRFPNTPIIINEDGPTGNNTYDPADFVANLDAAVTAGAGWGYYDQDGFQDNTAAGGTETRIRWEIDSASKEAFFDRVAELTGN